MKSNNKPKKRPQPVSRKARVSISGGSPKKRGVAPSKADLIARRKAEAAARRRESQYGTFSDSGRGFGFVELQNEDGTRLEIPAPDLFVPPSLTMNAMAGDFVAVRRIMEGERDYGRGNEGEVTEILRRVEYATGLYDAETRTVSCRKTRLTVVIGKKSSGVTAETGDKVKVHIVAYPDRDHDCPLGEIIENFGSAETVGANYAAVLDEAGIPTGFTPETVAAAEAASNEPLSVDGRLDLRDKIIFTIDGAGAKDLDDAISLEKTEGGWLLGVHIADVSHYVTPGSPIDTEAYSRGTSVYFTDKVVPMLPESLSNGACSLNGGVERYAMTALIDLDGEGEITGAELHKSIIKSAVRGVYSEVNDIFENGSASEFAEKYRAVLPMLDDMHAMYLKLVGKSERRGAAELESIEPEIILGADGMPAEITVRERGDGEKMIEQFMVTANEAVARYLREHKLPGLYRIHEAPDPEKIRAFAIFANNLGLPCAEITEFAGTKDMKSLSAALNKTIDAAKAAGIGEAVSGVMLRSMAKAKYSPSPLGHFGLALADYCHFTSPIRRYPDLFVHRVISAVLDGNDKAVERCRQMETDAGAVCSDNELRAMRAERDIEDLYMCVYMRGFIGVEMDATVTGVTKFGLFARTEKYCEGMIPITSIEGGGEFLEASYTLKCAGRSYTLGDRLRVVVTAADTASGRVTLGLAPEIK